MRIGILASVLLVGMAGAGDWPQWQGPAGDGISIILSERGELVLARATSEGFDPLWREQILGGRCWTMPVLAHGNVYARNARGDLVCVQLRRQD